MTGKELLRLLQKHGWKIDRIHGSHHVLKKGNDTITVPVHGNGDIKKGLLQSILKQTGLKGGNLDD
ncbi:MAG: type II toxin-antitoxin system HicA family toxin [Peptococcaceae bacterium]|nr:type II toxin-antitoxin system HicA family toxin [Peptococcaceae bacterium]MBQ3509472.1 type II toxin-antitoxin system HicA family toxin [Peptococcaceae bacterium]